MDREYYANLRFVVGIFLHSDNNKEMEVIINELNVVSMNINGDYVESMKAGVKINIGNTTVIRNSFPHILKFNNPIHNCRQYVIKNFSLWTK